MNIENPSLQKGIELTEELCDIQADYIARLVELFSIIEQEGPTREFEMTSRGLTEEDISILRSIPASCLRDLPIAFEIDTGPLKKLNKFIEDNGLSYDSLPDEISVISESLQADRTNTLAKNKRL